jgi:hypothetical protein
MAQRPKAKPKPKGRKSTAGRTDEAQSERFIETARMLQVDETGEKFNRAMRALAPRKTASKKV